MKKIIITVLTLTMMIWSQDNLSDSTMQEYTIEKPGTITFTVGAKIKGKVEKPQVLIFLPKEKIQYQEMTLDRTFMEDLCEPLPYLPLVK